MISFVSSVIPVLLDRQASDLYNLPAFHNILPPDTLKDPGLAHNQSAHMQT